MGSSSTATRKTHTVLATVPTCGQPRTIATAWRSYTTNSQQHPAEQHQPPRAQDSLFTTLTTLTLNLAIQSAQRHGRSSTRDTWTNTHTHAHTRAHAHTRTCAHTHMHTHHTHAHTHTHTHRSPLTEHDFAVGAGARHDPRLQHDAGVPRPPRRLVRHHAH